MGLSGVASRAPVAIGLWVASALAASWCALTFRPTTANGAYLSWPVDVPDPTAVLPGHWFAALTVVLMVLAWFCVVVTPSVTRWAGLLMAVWAVPMLVAPPLFSQDVFAYLEGGWMADQGLDPYTTGVGTVATSPYVDLVQAWHGSLTPYPPLSIALYEAIGRVTDFDVTASTLLARIPALICVLALLPLCRRLARRLSISEHSLLCLVPLNPLFLAHGVGAAHLDAIAAALVAAAYVGLLDPARRGQVAAIVCLSAAALFRQPAALAALPLCWGGLDQWPVVGRLRQPWRYVVSTVAVALAALACCAALTALTDLGWGWVHNSGTPGLSAISPLGFLTVLAGGDYPPAWAQLGAIVVALAVAVTALRFAWPHSRFLAVGLALVALTFLPLVSLRAWYYLIPILVLALGLRVRHVRLGVLTLTMALLATDLVWEQDLLHFRYGSMSRAVGAAAAIVTIVAMTAIVVTVIRRPVLAHLPTVRDKSLAPSG